VSDIKIRIICESVANQNPDFDKDQQAADKEKKERCNPGILLFKRKGRHHPGNPAGRQNMIPAKT